MVAIADPQPRNSVSAILTEIGFLPSSHRVEVSREAPLEWRCYG